MEDRAMNAPHAEAFRVPPWTLAVGVLIGAIVLGQAPSFIQGIGVVIVVAAGIAARRDGRRHGDLTDVIPSSGNVAIIPVSRLITQGRPDMSDQRKDTFV